MSPDSLFNFTSRDDVRHILRCSDKEVEGDSWFQITHPYILHSVEKQKQHLPFGHKGHNEKNDIPPGKKELAEDCWLARHIAAGIMGGEKRRVQNTLPMPQTHEINYISVVISHFGTICPFTI